MIEGVVNLDSAFVKNLQASRVGERRDGTLGCRIVVDQCSRQAYRPRRDCGSRGLHPCRCNQGEGMNMNAASTRSRSTLAGCPDALKGCRTGPLTTGLGHRRTFTRSRRRFSSDVCDTHKDIQDAKRPATHERSNETPTRR